MDIATLIPVADSMPVHWVWLLILLTATTFLHLVAMNVMLGTGFIAFVISFMKGESARPMVATVAGTMTYSTALTINMGVAPLLFIQVLYGQFFYTSTVLMATYWLTIVLLLIITYYSIYVFKANFNSTTTGLLFLGIPVVLMSVVALLFVNNISLMQIPASWLKYFECRGGWLLNFDDAVLLPRYLHIMLSAIAVGGLAIAALYDLKRRRGEKDVEHWISSGCNWFTASTIINFGIGFWFLGTLPDSVTGPDAVLHKLFMLLIILSVGTAAPAMIFAQSRQIGKAVGWTLLTILLMTVSREVLRMAYLYDYFYPSGLPVSSQYSPFVVFLVLAVAVVSLFAWMGNKVRLEMEVEK